MALLPSLSHVEVEEGPPKLLALAGERSERAREASLSLGREREVGDAAVRARGLALDETDLLGAADELGHARLRELEALRQIGHG